MEPMLSFIIPCYNGEKFLAEAVNSILKQPCRDLEIIIVDDGSRDSSGTIADRFAAEYENIRVFHTPNGGVSAARNIGIDHAAGKYIGFLDADDVLCRNAYDQQIHGSLEAGQYDILSFSYLTGMENLQYGRMMPANAPGLYLREDTDYIWQTEKHFCSYLYSKLLFEKGLRFPEGVRYNEDLCFLFLAARGAGQLMQFDKPWFVYRMNPASVMHNLKDTEYLLEAITGISWCRQNSRQPKDIRDCEGNLFACMVKYIRLSCMQGVPVSAIVKNVLENQSFQTVMQHYGEFWVSEDTAKLYSSFMETPRKVWLKHRLMGLVHSAAQRLTHTKPGSIVNQKLRYKLVLRDYLVE